MGAFVSGQVVRAIFQDKFRTITKNKKKESGVFNDP
jgi:hypothetical protein